MINKGLNASLEEILVELQKRDERDTQRAVAPLRPAEEAIMLDSTSLTIEQVLEIVLEEARHRGLR